MVWVCWEGKDSREVAIVAFPASIQVTVSSNSPEAQSWHPHQLTTDLLQHLEKLVPLQSLSDSQWDSYTVTSSPSPGLGHESAPVPFQ